MAFRDPGDGIGKRERRAFALGVKRRLLPRVQHVESLLGLAEGAGVFRMQIEAIRTSIDLRGTHLHQVSARADYRGGLLTSTTQAWRKRWSNVETLTLEGRAETKYWSRSWPPACATQKWLPLIRAHRTAST